MGYSDDVQSNSSKSWRFGGPAFHMHIEDGKTLMSKCNTAAAARGEERRGASKKAWKAVSTSINSSGGETVAI
uniref:Uncharacterized protein n=1 Tax=Oryza nivara TaxID=4536 RepID=A0A0E0HN39_ORYNI